MSSNPTKVLEIHIKERAENKENWSKKPRLQKEYGEFYRLMRKEMTTGPSLEIGSGMGNIKKWIPAVITSEKDPDPDAERQESAYQLSYPDESLGNILALDVWHHLEFPEKALNEWKRCLRVGGKVILMEPGMGLLGQLVYGLFHHEPVGWNTKFRGAAEWSEKEEQYFACQSSAHQHFVSKNLPLDQTWIIETKQISSLVYLTTGGFSKPEMGIWTATLLQLFQPIAKKFPSIFGTRLLVVLQKTQKETIDQPG